MGKVATIIVLLIAVYFIALSFVHAQDYAPDRPNPDHRYGPEKEQTTTKTLNQRVAPRVVAHPRYRKPPQATYPQYEQRGWGGWWR